MKKGKEMMEYQYRLNQYLFVHCLNKLHLFQLEYFLLADILEFYHFFSSRNVFNQNLH